MANDVIPPTNTTEAMQRQATRGGGPEAPPGGPEASPGGGAAEAVPAIIDIIRSLDDTTRKNLWDEIKVEFGYDTMTGEEVGGAGPAGAPPPAPTGAQGAPDLEPPAGGGY